MSPVVQTRSLSVVEVKKAYPLGSEADRPLYKAKNIGRNSIVTA